MFDFKCHIFFPRLLKIILSLFSMKRNVFFAAFFVIIALLSCRNNDEPIQQIDQIVHLYIDSLGQDMLNKKIAGSYISVSLNDVDGLTDNAPVTYLMKKDADTVDYIQYIAGAKRILTDSIDANHKTYRSRIALKMILKVNATTQSTTNDTLILNYQYTPEYFRVSSALYNNKPVFTKAEGQPNIIKIHK